MRLTVEVRDASGRVLARTRVAHAVPHASRDVALLMLAKNGSLNDNINGRGAEDMSVEEWSLAAASAGVRACSLLEMPPSPGALLRLLGHTSSGTLIAEDGNESPMLPMATVGKYLGRSDAAQSFASTARPCETGMCGGPVILAPSDDETADGVSSGSGNDAPLACLGMIEGVVTPPAAAQAPSSDDAASMAKRRAAEVLANAAVFIDAALLRAFVEEQEALQDI